MFVLFYFIRILYTIYPPKYPVIAIKTVAAKRAIYPKKPIHDGILFCRLHTNMYIREENDIKREVHNAYS